MVADTEAARKALEEMPAVKAWLIAETKRIDAIAAYNLNLSQIKQQRRRGDWSGRTDDDYQAVQLTGEVEHLAREEMFVALSALSPKSEEEKWIAEGDQVVVDGPIEEEDSFAGWRANARDAADAKRIASDHNRRQAIERAAQKLLNHIECITYRDSAGLRLSAETVPHVAALRRAVEEGAEG